MAEAGNRLPAFAQPAARDLAGLANEAAPLAAHVQFGDIASGGHTDHLAVEREALDACGVDDTRAHRALRTLDALHRAERELVLIETRDLTGLANHALTVGADRDRV